jgi:hypothetical protein
MTTKPQKIEMTKQTKQPEREIEVLKILGYYKALKNAEQLDKQGKTDFHIRFFNREMKGTYKRQAKKIVKLLQSQADKTREQVLGGVLRSVQPRGAIRCTWCKMATMDCECKENLEELINKLKNK